MHGRLGKTSLLGLLLCSTVAVKAEAIAGQGVRSVNAHDMGQWLIALVLVLALFFVLLWILRRLGALPAVSTPQHMRVLSVVSLGMREKVVLLRVGSKQLVLAVTPGHIETLATLEGEACFTDAQSAVTENNFAQKLMQAIKGQPDA